MNHNHIKDLSIQISLNGLSFCILNRTSNRIELLEHQDFDKKLNPFELLVALKSQLATLNLLEGNFSSIVLIHHNELSNLVPEDYFSEDLGADYLKFSSKILSTDYVSHDELAINQSVNVYVPYVNVNNHIFETFGEFVYKHASTIYIDTILQLHSNYAEDTVYLNLNRDNFEVVAVKRNQLQLYNRFEFSSKEDVIYYLLFAMEQLNFNPETAKIKLTGNIQKHDDFYDIIYKYVRFVEFYEPNYSFEFAENATLENKHNHFILLNSL